MILILPCRRESISVLNHVCSAQGESPVPTEHYLKWEWKAGEGCEDLQLQMLLCGCCPGVCSSRFVPFPVLVSSLSTGWQINGWHRARVGVCLREISPTDPIPVMHKKNDRSNIFVLVSLPFILFDQGWAKLTSHQTPKCVSALGSSEGGI